MEKTLIIPIHSQNFDKLQKYQKFGAEKIILLAHTDNVSRAKEFSQLLGPETHIDIITYQEESLEEIMKLFHTLSEKLSKEQVHVVLTPGNEFINQAILSASFSQGYQSYLVREEADLALPVLNISYYDLLSKNKKEILKLLKLNTYVAMQDISKKLHMSIALLSYHINGTPKHQGLKSLRLIKTKEQNKKLYLKLSQTGHYLIPADQEKE